MLVTELCRVIPGYRIERVVGSVFNEFGDAVHGKISQALDVGKEQVRWCGL